MRRLGGLERLDRLAAPVLLVAIIVYAGVALYLTRGVIFTGDELGYFGGSTGWAPGDLFHPHNGHAIVVTRVIYEASLSIFGAEYLPIKLSMIAAVSLTAWLLFVFLSRRVGRTAAVFPAVLLLFAGANPVLIQGNIMMFAQASAAGLGALIMLDRRDRLGDVVAAALLTAACFSIEAGVGFAFGVALWLLLGGDWRRAWVGLLPLVAYGIWFLWARQFDQESGELANVLLAPAYAADSLAAAVGSYFGFAIDFTDSGTPPGLDWGRVLAAVAVCGIVWRAVRHPPSAAVLAPIGILLVLWIGGSLVYGPKRSPVEPRYLMVVGIAVLLIAGEVYRGWRPGRAGLLGLLAVAVLAIPGGLHLLRAHAGGIRSTAANQQGFLVALELQPDEAMAQQPVTAAYIRGVESWGSLTIPAAELPAAAPAVRAEADQTLGELLEPRLEPAPRRGECDPAAEGEVELPAGGAVLVSSGGGSVTLRRFGDQPVVAAGELAPGEPATLALRPDASQVPWKATVAGGGEIRVCALAPAPG